MQLYCGLMDEDPCIIAITDEIPDIECISSCPVLRNHPSCHTVLIRRSISRREGVLGSLRVREECAVIARAAHGIGAWT